MPGIPTRGAALRLLARPALLLLWALVLWGTLLLGAALLDVPADGAAEVWRRLWPEHGASVWAWVNLASVPLALVAWLLAAAQLVRSRREP